MDYDITEIAFPKEISPKVDLRSENEVITSSDLVGDVKMSQWDDNLKLEKFCARLSELMREFEVVKIDVAFDPYKFKLKGGESE